MTFRGEVGRTDRVVVVSAAGVALLSLVWFTGPAVFGDQRVGWALAGCAALLSTVATWRAVDRSDASTVDRSDASAIDRSGASAIGRGDAEGTSEASDSRQKNRAVTRFWRRLLVAVGLFGVGLAVDGVVTGSAVDRHHVAAPAMVPYYAGVVVLLWAFAGLPTPRVSRKATFAYLLDASTTMLAAGLFGWHLWLQPALSGGVVMDAWSLAGSLVMITLGLFAVVKVGLAWSGPVDRPALALLGLAVLTGVSTAIAGTAALGASHLSSTLLAMPLTAALWVVAAVRQRYATRLHRPRRHAARRPVSLAPYLAAGCVAMLVLVAGPGRGAEGRLLISGSVLLVALVVARQLVALYENAYLLRRVDAGMRELRRHERRFRSLVQNSTDIIMISTPGGRALYASPALQRVLGLGERELVDRRLGELVHPDDLGMVKEQIFRAAQVPGRVVSYRARFRDAAGAWHWLDVVTTNLLADPSVNGLVSNARDVTETLRYEARLAHQATHDELTELPNRALLHDRTRAALSAAGSGRASLALIDLDDFKGINDRLGHAVGDALLVGVGGVLAGCVGAGDTVARLGGDEFAVLLAGGEPAEAEATLDRIIEALGAPVAAAGYDLLVQASIGLAHGRPGDEPAELVRRADIALYAAKDHGKGRYATYEPALDRRSAQHAQIGAQLRQALDAGDQLHMVYQPIVTLPDGRITGVEALVRWKHPERGPVSPVDFIPIAERTGLIMPMGRWILREACGQAARWAADPQAAPVTMSVNVSARQLREPTFPHDLAEVLAETGLDPARLTIEVTETAVFDSGPAVSALRRVHELGVRVALDDFGTGHSSLGLLRSCPVDILKVDKSFVDEVTRGAEHAAIAMSLIQITSTLSLHAVAEGVESADQARALHRMGYRLAQGYHFARPMDPAAVRELLVGARLAEQRPDEAPASTGRAA